MHGGAWKTVSHYSPTDIGRFAPKKAGPWGMERLEETMEKVPTDRESAFLMKNPSSLLSLFVAKDESPKLSKHQCPPLPSGVPIPPTSPCDNQVR